MPTIDEYKSLVTSEYQGQPNFMAMIDLDVSLPVRVQELMSSMIPLFDVDVAAGSQLDIIGQWVGIGRNVTIPIEGIFFSWDGDYTVGWEYGIWQSVLAPTSVTVLPDDVYRTLIRAKIAANRWDGTTDGAYTIWEQVFPNITILIQDKQDMSYDLALIGGIIDSLTLALLRGGYIPLKPEGVHVNVYYAPVNDGPFFGWDLDSTYVQGWEIGSWARELSPT